MKTHFFKATGIAALVCTLCLSGAAQEEVQTEKAGKSGDQQEIIIRKKSDKDIKITVEIKDGKVLINGKPVDEFNDDNLSVLKKTIRIQEDGDAFAFIAPDAPSSPFRAWSYGGGNSFNGNTDSHTGFLGVTSSETDGGVKITEVTKASAAEKSGLQKGDVISKIDDKPITSPEELSKAIHGYKSGDKVTVTYKRDGKEQKATATLGSFKVKNVQVYNYNMNSPDMESLGKLRAFSDMDRMNAPRAYSWNNGRPKIGLKAQDTEDGKGVKVIDVDDESPADKAGIKEGDLITEFDGKAVNSAEELSNQSRAAKDKASFKVKLKRDDKAQEVEIKIPKKLKTANL